MQGQYSWRPVEDWRQFECSPSSGWNSCLWKYARWKLALFLTLWKAGSLCCNGSNERCFDRKDGLVRPGIFLLFGCDEVHALLVEARSFSEIVMLHILTFIPFFVFLLYFLDLENLLELSRIMNVLEMILDFSSLELAFDYFIFTLDYLLTILISQNLEELISITKMYQVYLEVNLGHLLLRLYHFHF